MKRKQCLIGIDGGASYIRVVVADYAGNILSHIKYQGGAAIQKNDNPKENMHNAIEFALKQANIHAENVIGIGAGISGYDGIEDLVWVNTLIDLDGLDCAIKYVNDAEVAHIGAFYEKSGVIAICGTGSIVFGKDEVGTKIRNYDLDDYAYSAARHLTQNFINRVVNNENNASDDGVLSELLKHFGVESVSKMSIFAAEEKELQRGSNPKQFGEFAKYITGYALCGSHLCRIVCEDAGDEICKSIDLVAKNFNPNIVDAALVGSVANSKYICDYINKKLSSKGYNVKRNTLLPEIGGVLLAMKSLGITVDQMILDNLSRIV